MRVMEFEQKPINSAEVSHAAMMTGLASRHDILVDLIGDRPLHYVDFPVHGNIGDLLIMHGTLAFFRKNNLVPRLSAPAFTYEPEWIDKGEVIVFHGGGNFGDLYAEYGMQLLREYVVSSRPENRIIVLPQTIHFSSAQERQRSAKLFRTHPDVHICVRDHASYQIAQEFSDYVYLLPDMAHQLYRINPSASAQDLGTLLISRMDDEKSDAAHAMQFDAVATTDWPLLVGDSERHIESFRRAMRVMHRFGMGWLGNQVLSGLWARYSGRLITNAITLFSAHERIVTDRLHGHILACLMDKPNTVLDNSYGKNSSYVSAWTVNSELVTLQKI